MTNPVEQMTWEEVLDAYVTAAEAPSHELLMEWIRRFPDYRQALIEFTAAWSLMENCTPDAKDRADEDDLVLQGMSVVQDLLHSQLEKHPDAPPESQQLKSLFKGADLVMWSPDALASHLKLSLPLIVKIDRHLIEGPTVPLQLTEKIAASLQCDVVTVARFMAQRPSFQPQASYKSRQTPTLPAAEDFFEAVRNDLQISDEDRQYWLAMDLPKD